MKNKSVCVSIAGVLVWFYGPRLAYIFEWPFGFSLKIIGVALIVAGGINLLIKLSTKTEAKKQEERPMIIYLLLAIGILIFFGAGAADYFIEWCPSGHVISIVGAGIFVCGVFLFFREFFKELKDKEF